MTPPTVAMFAPRASLHQYMTVLGWIRKDDHSYDSVTYWGMAFGEQKQVRLVGYGDMVSIEPFCEVFHTTAAGFLFRVLAVHATQFDLAEAAVTVSREEEFRRHAALEKLGG